MADYSDYKECADCVHYELCLHQEKFLIEHNRKDLIRRYGFGLCEPENCCNFKDRSRFVELPCKVGDILYHPVPLRNVISEYKIKSFQIYPHCVWVNWNIVDGIATINLMGIYANGIGETVFLTREEAEQALKERENDEK